MIAVGPTRPLLQEASPEAVPTGRVLLLGLGNDILCDDAVGLRVTRHIRDRLGAEDRFEVRETEEMGLALLDFVAGYQGLLLVDAVQTGRAAPGHLHELNAGDLPPSAFGSPHFLGVNDTLALGRHLGLVMPDQVKVFAIEVSDPFTLSWQMTPALEAAVPAVAQRILAALRQMAGVVAAPAPSGPPPRQVSDPGPPSGRSGNTNARERHTAGHK